MRHFFAPEISAEEKTYRMNSDESKHILKVLRLKEGDVVGLLDGKGSVFQARISLASQKACEFELLNHEVIPQENYEIHIAIAPTKQTERMEWFVEKATELGATHITFVDTKNGERAQYKYDRFERKMISAFKQSKRYYLPKLSEKIIPLKDFFEAYPNGLIAHCYETEKRDIRDTFKTQSCPILIGPEGDFTSEEVELSAKYGYEPISLGNTRLRTETAALYACSIMKFLCE